MKFAILISWALTHGAVAAAPAANGESCAKADVQVEKSKSEFEIYDEELREADLANIKLLQLGHSKLVSTDDPDHVDYKKGATESIGGDHKYLLVRPCQRWAGDGRSGLPRHRVTGECCGDGVCSPNRWESYDTCRVDCMTTESNDTDGLTLESVDTALFGSLESVAHEQYHCEDGYENGSALCSQPTRNESLWLESMLFRGKNGLLPFEMPPPGSIAVEFGCGLGQDSRNLAQLAGFSVTAIDVSASAIEQAKQYTSNEMLGFGPSKIEFVAYDAFAVPAPTQRVDFFFDATVYCGLRHTYLSRDYQVWARLFTPGHTLVHIQCWMYETDHPNMIAKARRDMEADFEPMFDILLSEACPKNQGGIGWCFHMRMRSEADLEEIARDRLTLQRAARDGDVEKVRGELSKRSGGVSVGEYRTLSYIAQANHHYSIARFMETVAPNITDEYSKLAYGMGVELESVAEEDRLDGEESRQAKLEVEHMKVTWERAELGEFLIQSLESLNKSASSETSSP